jgi:hypothetical protein
MDELYLSSRTEVLRSMNIDTGRKVAIIGAPEDFIVWMNKILPIHTCIAGIPIDMGGERDFDIILWWTPRGAEIDGIEILIEHLTSKGDLWIIVGREIPLHDRNDVLYREKERTLMITTTLDLVPVIMRSATD